MDPPLEIMVHVSGPSLGADDARYRREASGFLQFDVAKRHTLLGQASHTPNAVEQTHLGVGIVDAEEDQYQTSKAAHKSRVQDWPDRLPPLRTPGSHRPTTSTLPWTATKQTPHLLIERTPAFPRPHTAPSPATLSHAPPLRRSQSDSWQTPPSEIPDSQPTPRSSGSPEKPSSPYLKRPFASSSPSPTRPASSPTAKRPRLPLPSSLPSEDKPIKARPRATAPFSSPPSAKRPRLQVPSSPPSNIPAFEARSPAAAPSSSLPSAETPPASSLPPNERLRLEIHPPRPKTSNGAFKTHLTPSLKAVAERLPLADHFKPITVTRTLRVLERGHWLVPIDGWDEELKQGFWKFLAEFIGHNQAGWGTWCVRETQEPVRVGDSDKENHAPQPREVVKVYCWGEVVGEVWLLLFIGVGTKFKKIGARWVDAGGVAVVVMEGG